MTNDPDLMAFNNWRAVQPDVEQSGLVFAANDHAAKSCSVWWAGAGTEFLDRTRAEARARGITLFVNHAPYSRQELQEAVALIWGRRERLGQLGFGLQTIAGPTPTFFGLTVAGFVLGDEEAKQLPPALVASVRGELADLLGDCQVRLDDVRIEYGRVYPASVSAAAHAPACDNRPMPERLEVQRAVAASAGEIFAVLTDPRGHVAIDSSGMLMAASGDAVTKAGDTFVVHMDREALNDYPLGLYDVTIEIVTFEQDREIAWTVHGQFDLGHVYGYRLEPIAQGTLVTSYYDWSAVDQSWKDAAIFPVIPESALRATLGILARTAAPGKPRPALEDE